MNWIFIYNNSPQCKYCGQRYKSPYNQSLQTSSIKLLGQQRKCKLCKMFWISTTITKRTHCCVSMATVVTQCYVIHTLHISLRMNITKKDILIAQMAWPESLSEAAMQLCCSSYSWGTSMENWWRLTCKGILKWSEKHDPMLLCPSKAPCGLHWGK